jgi:hypothetical protein
MCERDKLVFQNQPQGVITKKGFVPSGDFLKWQTLGSAREVEVKVKKKDKDAGQDVGSTSIAKLPST